MKNKLYTLRLGLLLIIVWLIKPTMVFAFKCDNARGWAVGTSYGSLATLTFDRLNAGMPVTNWDQSGDAHAHACVYSDSYITYYNTWLLRGVNYTGKDIFMDGRLYSIYSLQANRFGSTVNDLFGVILEYQDINGYSRPLLESAGDVWTRMHLTDPRSPRSIAYVKAKVIALKNVPAGEWLVHASSVTRAVAYICRSNSIDNSCVPVSSPMDSVSYLSSFYVVIKMPTCNVNYSNVVNLKAVNSIDFNRAVNNTVETTPFSLRFDCEASASGGAQPVKVGLSFQDANRLASNGNVLTNVAVNASNATLALYSKPGEGLQLNSKIPVFDYQSNSAAQFTKSFYVSYISTAANTTPGAVKSTVMFNITYD
ncbi:MAG: fimbrial protein [Aeromonas veronii]